MKLKIYNTEYIIIYKEYIKNKTQFIKFRLRSVSILLCHDKAHLFEMFESILCILTTKV